LLIQPMKDIQAVKPFSGDDARRTKCPDFKEDAEQEGVRAEHECRVVNDLRDLEFITRDYLVTCDERDDKERNIRILHA
jgi:hypothetical protein